MKLTTCFDLLLRLRMTEALVLLPVYALMACIWRTLPFSCIIPKNDKTLCPLLYQCLKISCRVLYTVQLYQMFNLCITRKICHQVVSLEWRGENYPVQGVGFRAGDQEVPMWVPELSTRFHVLSGIWHCLARPAVIFSLTWVIFHELHPQVSKKLCSRMWHWMFHEASENGQVVHFENTQKKQSTCLACLWYNFTLFGYRWTGRLPLHGCTFWFGLIVMDPWLHQ